MTDVDLPFEARLLSTFAPRGNELDKAVQFGTLMKDYVSADATKAQYKTLLSRGIDKLKSLNVSQPSEKDLPSEDFAHTPLADNGSHFRLLTVQPVTEAAHLRLALEEHPKASSIPYVALSYVWMDYGPMMQVDRDYRHLNNNFVPSFSHADRRSVILNGKKTEIGTNLHAALVGLQPHLNGRPIWTDALCVDQSDRTEKTCQISRMGEVYNGADEVFIWLGQSHALRDVMVDLTRHWPDFPEDPQNPTVTHRGKTYSSPMAFFQAKGSGVDVQSWACLGGLVSEGWFNRSWTVQEFILARKYTFFYDGQVIPSSLMEKAMRWTYFLVANCPSVVPSWLTLQPSIFALRTRFQETGQKMNFLDAALLGATRLAADPRDKIWAYLYLIDESTAGGPDFPPLSPGPSPPNLETFYLDVATRLVHGAAGLGLLSLVHHPLPRKHYVVKSKKPIGNRLVDNYKAKKRFQPPNPDFNPPKEDVFDEQFQPDFSGNNPSAFPSWAPRLASGISAQPLFLREMRTTGRTGLSMGDASWRIFHAVRPDSDTTGRPSSLFTLSGDRKVLTVQARRLDTIKTISASEPGFYNMSLTPPKTPLHKDLKKWFADLSGTYTPTQEPLLSACTRTFLANIWLAIHPAPLPQTTSAARLSKHLFSSSSPAKPKVTPSQIESFFLSYLAATSTGGGPSGVKKDFHLKEEPDVKDAYVWQAAIRDVGAERVLYLTAERGFLGLAPGLVREGDEVWLVRGQSVPFILRRGSTMRDDDPLPAGAGNRRRGLVGESYVHGVMYGEEDGGQHDNAFENVDLF